MRKVTMEDIRLGGNYGDVVTLPLWACRRDGYGDYVPIEEAWSEVRAELERRGPLWTPLDRNDRRPGRVLGRAVADQRRECAACGETFLARYNSATCSQRCFREHRRKLRRVGRQHGLYQRPHVVHDPRPCDQCGESFAPARADARYCSGKCRVAHHRANAT